MNEELLQFYITGLIHDWFHIESNTSGGFPDRLEHEMRKLEKNLGRSNGHLRKLNPEYQEALKLYTSPLCQALK